SDGWVALMQHSCAFRAHERIHPGLIRRLSRDRSDGGFIRILSKGIRALGFYRNEKTFHVACQEPLDDAFIGSCRAPLQPILTASDALDLKLLARFDAVLLPQFSRKHNLAF